MEANNSGPARTGGCADIEGGCRVEELFQLLSKSHTMGILHLFIHGDGEARRFVDIQKALAMSPNTLSHRLKELVEAGFLTRTAYNEIPPRVDYAATAKTYALCTVFRAMGEWAQQHDLRPAESEAEEIAVVA